jgi:hypothetical protein
MAPSIEFPLTRYVRELVDDCLDQAETVWVSKLALEVGILGDLQHSHGLQVGRFVGLTDALARITGQSAEDHRTEYLALTGGKPLDLERFREHTTQALAADLLALPAGTTYTTALTPQTVHALRNAR